MADTTKPKKESVLSPSSATDGVRKNCGGMPPEMSVKEIFAENLPPTTPAESSTANLGKRNK